MRDRMIFRCDACGDYVVDSADGAYLDCCGRSRVKLAVHAGDASLEMHVPVLERKEGKLTVRVGKAGHPMSRKHFIDWIGLEMDGMLLSVTLKPGDAPAATFDRAAFSRENSTARSSGKTAETPPASGKIRLYAHCTLHGLWKAEA